MSTIERERVDDGLFRRKTRTGYTFEARAWHKGRSLRRVLDAGTLAEARKERRDWLVDLGRSVPEAQSRRSGLSFQELVDRHRDRLEIEGSERSVENFDQRIAHLETFLGRNVSSITRAEVQQHATRLRRKLAASSVRSIIGAGSVCFRGEERNPFERIDTGRARSGPQRNWSIAEVLSLVDAGTETTKALIATIVFTGCRISEVVGLVWGDIDLDQGTVTISAQLGKSRQRVRTKTEAALRTLAIPATLVRELKRWKAKQLERGLPISDDAFVFLTRNHKPVDRHRAYRAVQEAARRTHLISGDETVRVHDLRSAYALGGLRAGADLPTVQRSLGHASAAMTMGYAKLVEQEQAVGIGDIWGDSKPATVKVVAR